MDDGKPLPVIFINDQGQPQFLEDNLTTVFCNEEVCNAKVALISVNGPFRKGKSFILNMFLDFVKQQHFTEWSDNISSNGFESIKGTRSVTKGLIVWSKPFIVEDNGEKICLFLMDTEGLFDTSSKPGEDLAIFALSTLLSSVQIYLFTGPLQTNDLECFEYFVQLARRFLCLSQQNPFQKLIFVLRDWVDVEEYNYGYDGGLKYLQDVFKNHQELGKGVFDSFEAKCFLLPYPGEAVAHGKFTGSTKDISPVYLKELSTLAESLLKLGNVSSKIFHGNSMTCQELSEYLKVIVTNINSSGIRDQSSLINSIITNGARLSVRRQIFNYSLKIQKACNELKGMTTYNWLKDQHILLLQECAINFIVEMQELGNSDEQETTFLMQLWEELDALYNNLELDRKIKCDNLTAAMEKLGSFSEQRKEFSKCYKKWLEFRKALIKNVSKLIEEIAQSKRKSLMSKVVTNGIALMGGIFSVGMAYASSGSPVGTIVAVGVSVASTIGSNALMNQKDEKIKDSLEKSISCWVQKDEEALKMLECEIEKLIFSMNSLWKSCENIAGQFDEESLSAISENLKEGLKLAKDYRELDKEIVSQIAFLANEDGNGGNESSNGENAGEIIAKLVSEQAKLAVHKTGDLPKLAAIDAVNRRVAKSCNHQVKDAIKKSVKSNGRQCAPKASKSAIAKSTYISLAVSALTLAYDGYQLGKSIYELSTADITLIEKFLTETKDRLQNEIEELANIFESSVILVEN